MSRARRAASGAVRRCRAGSRQARRCAIVLLGDAHAGREPRADDEADEIERVGHARGLIEIVDAPDKASFDVAPGAEILDMQVADREDFWRVLQFGAERFDGRRPAEVGRRAERRTRSRRIVSCLVVKSFSTTSHCRREPGLIGLVVVLEGHDRPRSPSQSGIVSVRRCRLNDQCRHAERAGAHREDARARPAAGPDLGHVEAG